MTPELVARKYGDKPSFAMTCNLLSQFIKDKGSIPDLAAAQGARPPASKNLVPGAAARSMELFPQRAPAAIAHLTHGDCSRMPENAPAPAPAPAPLTIFYGGRVVVFDDFPADKARDLMHFAAAAGKGRFVPPADHAMSNSKPTNPIAAVGQNVPIARKASLHRFLEKRKDRINAKTPYQDAGSPMVVKKEGSEPWLGLGSQSSN